MSFTKRVVAAVAVGILLTACDDTPQEQAASAPKSPQGAGKVAGLPPEMVAAVSAGKTATMISVHFALRAVPAVGTPLPADIAIVPHVPFTSVRVFFEARDGVTLRDGASMKPVTDAAPEKPILHKVVLQPTQEGVYMVTATVDTEGTEGSITRVFSIPVIINPTAGAAEPAVPLQPNPGEPAAATPPAS